ncbi:hypothetical protein SAMN06264365_12056 [Actinoplanes regularis]|uniref:Uncharacterized protein n=1 Tax=Actinoplanes regularis TaxID=52697 RepID=A0A239G760_9ACTN|nr:hypothetical protein SAMN06264365_12056 [Actinoplanes regularis]
MRGGCRGFIGPFPLPLWMRYSVVSRSLRRDSGFSAWSSRGVSDFLLRHAFDDGQDVTSLRVKRKNAEPQNTTAYTIAEIAPLARSSVWIGVESSPIQASL